MTEDIWNPDDERKRRLRDLVMEEAQRIVRFSTDAGLVAKHLAPDCGFLMIPFDQFELVPRAADGLIEVFYIDNGERHQVVDPEAGVGEDSYRGQFRNWVLDRLGPDKMLGKWIDWNK